MSIRTPSLPFPKVVKIYFRFFSKAFYSDLQAFLWKSSVNALPQEDEKKTEMQCYGSVMQATRCGNKRTKFGTGTKALPTAAPPSPSVTDGFLLKCEVAARLRKKPRTIDRWRLPQMVKNKAGRLWRLGHFSMEFPRTQAQKKAGQ
ncbi:MAG: hypothetical protein WBS33_05620 [Verrucomicrobiia bacterium]